MKPFLVLLALIGAVCAGGAIVYLNPSLVPRAEHAAQQGAAWASGEIAPATGPATPSAASATTVSPTTAPITLITPTPAAIAPADWTAADCAWAENIMTWDHSLDAAEAQKIADGQDTRYGTGPVPVQDYLTYAAEWQTALGQITEICDHTGMPAAPEQAATLQAFATAIAAHEADAASKAPGSTLQRLWYGVEGFFEDGTGWDIEWDNEWIGNYQRLTAMFNELPAS